MFTWIAVHCVAHVYYIDMYFFAENFENFEILVRDKIAIIDHDRNTTNHDRLHSLPLAETFPGSPRLWRLSQWVELKL